MVRALMETTKMTRKHFQLIADVLHKTRQELYWRDGAHETIDRLTEEFANELKKTNPCFNKDKFLRACGFTQG